MKYKELESMTESLRRDCSKEVFEDALNMYKIKGVKEEINSNIMVLENNKKDEYNIVCNNNNSLYLLHGKYGDFSHIKKCQIREELDDNDEYITKVNLTEYEDHLMGIVIREEQFYEDRELKEKLYNCSIVMRKQNSSKYVLEHELISEKLRGFDIHMYDYKNWSDKVMREWYIENFVDYFTNNNLDTKLRNILNENNKVLIK